MLCIYDNFIKSHNVHISHVTHVDVRHNMHAHINMPCFLLCACHDSLWSQLVACIMTWKTWQEKKQVMHDNKSLIMIFYQGWLYKPPQTCMIILKWPRTKCDHYMLNDTMDPSMMYFMLGGVWDDAESRAYHYTTSHVTSSQQVFSER